VPSARPVRLPLAAALAAAALAACPGGRREPAGCDLARGPCAAAAAGVEVRLELSPRPPRALRELELTVDASRGGVPLEGAAVAVDLSMPGMYMGENRAALAPAGGGRHRGKAVLVRCASGRRDWVAEVEVRPAGGGEPVRVRFPFEAAE
jgi:hypothetical protein